MRWWCAVAVGCVVSLPFGWVLSYAALLPFLLGLFFFVLIGLLVGAITHRVGSPGRPYGNVALVVGTTLIVGTGWVTSIVKESRDFPADMAVRVGNSTRDIGDRLIQQFHDEVADQIREFFRVQYPPGGTLGYMRWALTNGELRAGQIPGVRRHYRQHQRKFWWGVRVVLSVAMLGFGVASQTLLLRDGP